MKLFLDTADVAQIQEVLRWGIIDGVTTNPSHVARVGRPPSQLYPEICQMVPGPVSLEAMGLEADAIVAEGRTLARIADNVVVKIPVTREGLIAVRRLAAEGIKTNVTTTFSAVQALLAAKAGASYISPFVGRLEQVGHDGMELVSEIRTIYQNYGYETEIIVAAIRNPGHVLTAGLIGAHICTMAYDVLSMLYHHPLTDQVMQTFLSDWEKVPK
jgi:transaldolase